MRCFLLFMLSLLIISGCIEQPNSYTMLPPGEWRGILKLTDPDQINTPSLIDEEIKVTDYFELPFNFEVSYADEKMSINLINGNERIDIEEVHYGRDPATAKDTLQLNMNAFDTSMEGFYEENYIEGYWVVNYKKDYKIPFIATYGQNHRFIDKEIANTEDFDGKWKVIFEYDNKNAYPAIAEFE